MEKICIKLGKHTAAHNLLAVSWAPVCWMVNSILMFLMKLP